MLLRKYILFFLFILLLVACTPGLETAVPPTPIPATATPLPTATAVAPTRMPVPHPNAAPTAVPSPTAAIPVDPQVISPETIDQLTQLAQFGSGRIDNIAWSPDGHTFLVGSSNSIHFYEAATLQLLQSIPFPGYLFLREMQFSPDGDVLVATIPCGSNERECGSPYVDKVTGQMLLPFSSPKAPDFSSGGQTIVFVETVGEEMWRLVWQDVVSGESLQTLDLPYEPLAFSVASEMVVGMEPFGEGDRLHLYDMFSGELLHTLQVVSTANEATRTAYNATAQGDAGLFPGLEPHRIAFNPPGNRVAAVSYDHVVYIWDVGSGELLFTFQGHSKPLANLVYNGDGRLLATGSRDERLARLWDTSSGKLIQTFRDGWKTAFSPDQQTVAVANDSSVTIYELATGKPLRTLSGYNPAITSLAISPDGRLLAAAEDQTIALWDIENRQLIRTIDEHDLILGVAFNPDGHTLAWTGNKGVTLWDVVTAEVVANFQANGNQVGKIFFSPDGNLLTSPSSGSDAIFYLWDADTLAVKFSEANMSVSNVAFHPTAPLLAVDRIITTATGWEWQVQILDLESWQWTPTLPNVGPVITFTPDGFLLAADGSTTSSFAPIWAWDIVTGQPIRQITAPVYTSPVVLSPNGKMMGVYLENFSGLVFLDTSTGQPLGKLEGFSGEVRAAAIAPNGRILTTVTPDDIIRLWQIPGIFP